jgi:arginase family enzyme
LGGDHAVNIPCIRAYNNHGPIHIVQIDAHLDSSIRAMASVRGMETRCVERSSKVT